MIFTDFYIKIAKGVVLRLRQAAIHKYVSFMEVVYCY